MINKETKARLAEIDKRLYPAYLSKEEKADIKSALLKSLSVAQSQKVALEGYLLAIKRLNDYPETA